MRCGELVAFGMQASGALRVAVAMLDNGSCGEGGIRTAAAIHPRTGTPYDGLGGREVEGCRDLAGKDATSRRVLLPQPSGLRVAHSNISCAVEIKDASDE